MKEALGYLNNAKEILKPVEAYRKALQRYLRVRCEGDAKDSSIAEGGD